MKSRLLSKIAYAIFALTWISVPAVHAQNNITLEEIVVTAQARQQPLQDVPVSVVAVTGDALQDGAIGRLEDLQNAVPNFNLTETGIATNIFIRGIGSGINQGFEQSVGTYIDGVYYGRAQNSRAPFLDLQRIEVLRGPQSILFGKNSVGGALNITTAKPTDEFDGYIRLSNEFEDDELAIEGAISGPLTDKVRYRISARSRDADGYYENLTLNSNEAEREDFTFRGQLEADLTNNLTALLKVESSSFDVIGRNGEVIGEIPAAAGPFTGLTFSDVLVNVFGAGEDTNNIQLDDKRSSNGDNSFNESDTYALTLNWDLESSTFQSITALTDLDYNELCDCDFTGARVFDARLQEQYEQFSQEFRLTSDIGNTFDYILGAYYQTSEHDYTDQIIVETDSILVPAVNDQRPGAGNLIAGTQAARVAKVDSDVLSVFAQANWYLSDKLTLQLGGRFTREEKDGMRNMVIENVDGTPLAGGQVAAPLVYASLFGITSSNLAALGSMGESLQNGLGIIPISDSRTEDVFSPDIKLQYETNEDLMLYISYAKGDKSGGFDFRANNKSKSATLLDSFQFDTETANSIELGAKYRSPNGRGELNATAFFTDFDDLQISIFDGILGFNVGNAASAEIIGLELDGRYAVSDNFTLSGAIALTDFEFTDFENGQCYFGVEPDNDPFCSYTGNSQQMLSDVSVHLAADWDINITDGYYLNINGAVSYSSEYDASATYDPALIQDSFTKVDLRFSLFPESERWELALLAKNIGDERTLNFGGDLPLAGSTFGLKSNYSYWAQGRTLTLQFGVNF